MSTGFSWQEYWNGLPFLPSEDIPDLGIETMSPESSALASGSFTTEPFHFQEAATSAGCYFLFHLCGLYIENDLSVLYSIQ